MRTQLLGHLGRGVDLIPAAQRLVHPAQAGQGGAAVAQEGAGWIHPVLTSARR
jgi:hypothetical protein